MEKIKRSKIFRLSVCSHEGGPFKFKSLAFFMPEYNLHLPDPQPT